MFCKKDVLRNFVKPTGKHLRQGLFFNKVVAEAEACNFTKKETVIRTEAATGGVL